MVLFKSPNVFSGFLDPEDNAKAFTADGWLATGDLGWIDALGRLNLTGRSKDLIIRSGHNIDPKVIEEPSPRIRPSRSALRSAPRTRTRASCPPSS
jgi:fatty-acyl-CoA synthase